MKKTYKKPVIYFEKFSLATSIAGTCEVQTDTPAARQCGVDFGFGTLFLDDMNDVCSKPVEDEPLDMYDGACYDVPYDSKDLFNS